MLDKKNIVIKVKYPATKSPGPAAAKITTWHMPRVYAAITVLLLFIGGLFYFLLGGQAPENKPAAAEPTKTITADNPNAQTPSTIEFAAVPALANKETPISSTGMLDQVNGNSKIDVRTANAPKQATATHTASKPAIKTRPPVKKQLVTDNKLKTEQPLPLDKSIGRAILSQTLKGKEPGHEISGSVAANANNPTTLFYFTELRNMGGQTVYHEWLHNGKLVAKYELLVAADRWRTSSHRSFSDKSKGEWSVKLVDKNNKLLNQKIFNVKESTTR